MLFRENCAPRKFGAIRYMYSDFCITYRAKCCGFNTSCFVTQLQKEWNEEKTHCIEDLLHNMATYVCCGFTDLRMCTTLQGVRYIYIYRCGINYTLCISILHVHNYVVITELYTGGEIIL